MRADTGSQMTPAECKILLVDDDPAMLRILSRWLARAGYPVRTASDGQEAIEAVEAECPDVLLTDWEMPRVNGLELCQRVREMQQLPHYVYILFLTVRSASNEMVTGLEAGADDFISKPVLEAELLARLRSCLRVLKLQRRLSIMARTDPLTGLLTQRSFFECMEREWYRSKRFHLPLSCVMLDLDFFKRVNDIHGHQAGDCVLRFVADLLTQNSRASDCVCRYGGEEFCVLLPETEEADAAMWAERVRSRLASSTISTERIDLSMSGSFGVSERYDDTRSGEELVDLADQALLYAKRSGRDRVVRYQTISDTSNANAMQQELAGDIFFGVTAGQVMSPLSECLHENDTIGQAVDFFVRASITSSPVVNAEGNLCGVISEKDLMTAMILPNLWSQPLGTVMKPHVVSYPEDSLVQPIYEFLCRVSIRRVVIVRDSVPTGTISRRTLLRWIRSQSGKSGEEMPALDRRFESPPEIPG